MSFVSIQRGLYLSTMSTMGRVIKSSCNGLIGVLFFSLFFLVSCSGPLIDLSPKYEPSQFVVPETWHGTAPFREAQPAEAEAKVDWWKVFNDPLLEKFNKQALEENPDLQATAGRFIQARYEMMKVRAGYLPQIGIGGGA